MHAKDETINFAEENTREYLHYIDQTNTSLKKKKKLIIWSLKIKNFFLFIKVNTVEDMCNAQSANKRTPIKQLTKIETTQYKPRWKM